jgi:hypothetical protein
MTTPAQTEANRANGRKSTGPKTAGGKARSSRNALRHGLRSELPVLPGEDPRGWEEHRAGILRSLAPAGPLETELAGRVALSLWRLRRAAAYEAGVTAVGLDEVPEAVRGPGERRPLFPSDEDHDAVRLRTTRRELQEKREAVLGWQGTLSLLQRLPGLPDDDPVDGGDVYGVLQDVNTELPEDGADPEDPDFLAGLGVPEDDREEAWDWTGWTAALVRRAVEAMAQECGGAPERALTRALRRREHQQAQGQREVRRLGQEAARLERRLRDQEERLRLRRLLPDAKTLDKVLRYESHVSRQMLQALHTLERLQAARAGEPVPPPAALDVTISGNGPGPAQALPEGAAAVLEDVDGA